MSVDQLGTEEFKNLTLVINHKLQEISIQKTEKIDLVRNDESGNDITNKFTYYNLKKSIVEI